MMRRALVVLVVLCACGPKKGTTTYNLDPPVAGTPATVKGYLGIEYQPGVEANGPIKSLTNAPNQDTLVWTIVVADPAGDQSAKIRVPAQLGFPAKEGDVVSLKVGSYGGGPNVIPQLVLLDASGGVLVAINDRPPGWSAEKGRRLKLERGETDDEETFTVKLGPGDDIAEVAADLREVKIGGVAFYAQGNAVVRHLNKKHAPPDWVGSWIDFGVIRAQAATPGTPNPPLGDTPITMTSDAAPPPEPVEDSLVKPESDPKKIVGYARVPKQNEEFRANVIVTSLETSKADERVLWTIGLREDPFAKASPPRKFTLRVELPPQIALPLAKNDRVKVDVYAYGGGPNRRFSLLVTGDKSVPLLAIDKLPLDWETANGKKLKAEKGEPYDSVTYAVKIGPKGKQVTLDGQSWRAVTIDGVSYVGTATSVERKLHKRKMAPADYVGGWTDFTLIRVP